VGKPLLIFLCLILSCQIGTALESQHRASDQLPSYYRRIFLGGIPLYYWSPDQLENFGDYISLKLLERITHEHAVPFGRQPYLDYRTKLLAIGSILHFANHQDIVWGSGINGKHLNKEDYRFTQLDVRAIRGPLSRQFLMENFSIKCPEIYGDPALLFPTFFPEFKKSKNPLYTYIVIPHSSEEHLFSRDDPHIVFPTDPWDIVIEKILESQFVISSSLHGIVIAEAYGIPARLLKITENEPLFKYEDYYLGTGRSEFKYATSIKKALKMGGEPPAKCDLQKLYQAFPFEFWDNVNLNEPDFTQFLQ
jgi:pyruvyltransferase